MPRRRPTCPRFSPFEAPAINFTYARERLQKEYFHRWVHNPQRIEPDTKMPAYERDDGTTPITDVYAGDARKQFEAIWQYLLEGRESSRRRSDEPRRHEGTKRIEVGGLGLEV